MPQQEPRAAVLSARADGSPAPEALDKLNGLVSALAGGRGGRVAPAGRGAWRIGFPSAAEAVRCAVELRASATGVGSELRIGIHSDPGGTGEEAAGTAARLRETAGPGGIRVSGDVYREAAGSVEARFVERGRVAGPAGTEIEAWEIPGASGGGADELSEFVLAQLKRVGRRISAEKLRSMIPAQSPELERAIDRLAELGYLSRGDRPEPPRRRERYDRDEWRQVRHTVRDAFREAFRAGTGWPAYRARVIRRAERAWGGFVGHLVPFVMVNGFLYFIYAAGGSGFPWFFFPLGGWGIGLASHLASVRSRLRERAEVERLPETLGDEDFKALRKYHKARASFGEGMVAMTAVSLFLVVINMITSPFPWAIFPVGGIAMGMAGSASSYLKQRGQFRGRLRALFRRGAAAPRVSGTVGSAGESPQVEQAVRISNSILDQARGLDPAHAHLARDLKPMLEKYVDQIRTLTTRSREVEEIMAAIPRRELERDLERLRLKHGQTPPGPLREEYRRAVEQIERQNRSAAELDGQKELLDLHISNALGSLQQMQIDLARMKSLTPSREAPTLGALRERTRELSEFLDDLSAGYREVERMPELGERERREAQELLERMKKLDGEGPDRK